MDKTSKESPIYEMRVVLKGSKPPIWRRIRVSGETSPHDLHKILQTAMGWENCHQHRFLFQEGNGKDKERAFEEAGEKRTGIDQFISGEGYRFDYEYDFGDSWEHEIEVEKILPKGEGRTHPLCLEGEGACPPEDVGGIDGYYEFLKAIEDPQHPEHRKMMRWVSTPFDPRAFNPNWINRKLGKLKR